MGVGLMQRAFMLEKRDSGVWNRDFCGASRKGHQRCYSFAKRRNDGETVCFWRQEETQSQHLEDASIRDTCLVHGFYFGTTSLHFLLYEYLVL